MFLLPSFLWDTSEPLGALTALFFLQPYMLANPSIVGYAMCATGGIMIAVSLKELIPEAVAYDRPKHLIVGIVTGAMTIALTMQLGV
jgi:zinc transporter ZupT